jgi:hypothetical protein
MTADDLAPADRISAQEYYVRKDRKRRDFRDSRRRERRLAERLRKPRTPWPQIWTRNDAMRRVMASNYR